MGDNIEEIIAEPDEPSFVQNLLTTAHLIVTSNGWYILGIGALTYYLYQKFGFNRNNNPQQPTPQTSEEIKAFQAKEESRLMAVQRLQEKFAKESAERAEKMKKLEDEKRKARLEELEKLEKRGGNILGSKKSSFRPEYNPLAGDSGSSDRVCFRRPGAGSGGG